MEHINNYLQKQEANQVSNQQRPVGLPNQSLQTLSESENKMIELKYKSPQINVIKEVGTWAKILLLKIHVITGWSLPTDEMIETVLTDQFIKKLQEDYGDLNVDEIEYAFRSGGTRVKDWGKNMNLSLIDEVLIPYCHDRYELSLAEERLKNKPVQKIYTSEELDDIHRGDVEAFYQRCLKGIIPPNKLPEYYLSILIKDGYLAEGSDDLHGFFAYWIGKGYKNIYKNGD